MVSRFVQGTLLVLHTSAPPTEEEWSAYLEVVTGAGRQMGDLSRARMIVLTDGGGPDSAQRAAVTRAAAPLHGRTMRIAVVSSSLFVRALVSALTLLTPDSTIWAPAKIRDAFEHLRVERTALQSIWMEILRMDRDVGGTEVVRVASEALGKSPLV